MNCEKYIYLAELEIFEKFLKYASSRQIYVPQNSLYKKIALPIFTHE